MKRSTQDQRVRSASPAVVPLDELYDMRLLDPYPSLAPYLDSLGQTALVEVPSPKGGARIFAKCEWQNPTRTIKDRTAFAFVYDILRTTPSTALERVHILECTGGNLAFALREVCAPIGIRCTFVTVAGYLTSDERDLLTCSGHEVIEIDKSLGFEGTLDHGVELSRQHPDWRFLFQHENPLNRDAHRDFTGEEVVRQLRARGLSACAFTAAVGSAGTLIGVWSALDRAFGGVGLYVTSPAEKPYGSMRAGVSSEPSFSGSGGYTRGRKQPFVAAVEKRVVGYYELAFGEVMEHAAWFLRETGVQIGASSAANWLAAYRIAQTVETTGPSAVVSTVFSSQRLTTIEQEAFDAVSSAQLDARTESLGARTIDSTELRAAAEYA